MTRAPRSRPAPPASPITPPDPPISRILAGPGAGKTRHLLQSLQARLAAGAAPRTLLGVTYTRRAAQELLSRLGSRGPMDARSPWLGTFHQLARRILMETHRLHTPVDLDRLIPDAVAVLGEGQVPPWIAALALVAVDEAQDLDATQRDLLVSLLHHAPGCRLLLVGDPDQGIYSFRGASSSYLLHPEASFGPRCETIVLDTNYRSAQRILEVARAIIAPVSDPRSPGQTLRAARPEAHPAVRELVSDSSEAEATRIFEEVRTHLAVGVPADEVAILTRTRAQHETLSAEAQRWGMRLHMPPLRDGSDLEPPPPAPRAVQLLTMHQAKGCEWTVVVLAGCQEGLLPHAAAKYHDEIAEERRLLYVAVTRARQLLWLSRWGAPSPFLRGTGETNAHGSLLGRLKAWVQGG